MKKANITTPCCYCGKKDAYVMKMPRKEVPFEIFCNTCGFYVADETEEKVLERWNNIDAAELDKAYEKWLDNFEKSEAR